MKKTRWCLSAAFEVVVAAVPDRDMLVWKQTRRTYAEVEGRTRNLASFLRRNGIGLRRERQELERSECGQATVALLLYNCPEYVETMLGCYRARAVPFNVNQHYRPEEVRSLLDMLDAEAIVYHRALQGPARDSLLRYDPPPRERQAGLLVGACRRRTGRGGYDRDMSAQTGNAGFR